MTGHVDGFLRGKRFVILDRDSTFAKQFRGILADAGVEPVRTSYRAPNQNAFAERFVRSIKFECLDRLTLRRCIAPSSESNYLAHYHAELRSGITRATATD